MMRPRAGRARGQPISCRVPRARGPQTRQAAADSPPVLRVPVSDIDPRACVAGSVRGVMRESSASSRRPFRLRSTVPTGQHRVAGVLLCVSFILSPSLRHGTCPALRRGARSRITAATIPPSPSVPFFPSSMGAQNIQQQEIARKQCPSARRGLERASRQRERTQDEI